MGAQTQHKACPQVGRPNATQGTSASWAPQCTSATQMQGTPARLQLGRPNATQGTSGSWVPKRNASRVCKMGAQTQRKASSKDGRPNEKLIRNENVHTREHLVKRRPGGWIRNFFSLEVDFLIRSHPGWAPQRNERCVRKMVARTQRKARPQDGRPNEKLIRNKNVGRPNATQGTSGSWLPESNERRVRKMGTQMQRKPRMQRKARRHVHKLGAVTQHKARPQDGRPNAKLIRNENVHTRDH
jgi:hypothetical protein